MEGNTLKLQLLEKKDLTETEIDIRYSSMTQPLNRIVQYIRQQEYLIQGIFEKKLYQMCQSKSSILHKRNDFTCLLC